MERDARTINRVCLQETFLVLGWVRLLRAFGNCQYGLGGEVVDCTCSVVGGGYTVTPIIWKHDIEDGQFSGSIASYHL